MKLKEFHVIADITIKMLLYTHLIRIWTNNNHLKILSWLKYKSFHVYGTLKIFHLFSRKKMSTHEHLQRIESTLYRHHHHHHYCYRYRHLLLSCIHGQTM